MKRTFECAICYVALLCGALVAGELVFDVREAQLFLDDALVEHATLLQRVVHQPVGSSRNPIYVRLEVLDESGRPVPGFSYAESNPLSGDSLDGEPSWSDKPQNPDSFIGHNVRLQFYVRHADLFSFRATPRK